MTSMRVDTAGMEWTSGVPFHGPGAVREGRHPARPGRESLEPPSRGGRRAVSADGVLGWLRAAARRARQRRALAGLDDRMLKDIGVSRSEAMTEANKPFWRG